MSPVGNLPLASLADLLLTVGHWVLVFSLYGCILAMVIAYFIGKRKDLEAEEDAELNQRCIEGQRLKSRRTGGRSMRGNCHVPAEERWSA